MGYHQGLIISSRLDTDMVGRVIESACVQWPFLRRPRNVYLYRDRLLLASPELTEHLFNSEADYKTAVEQDGRVANELPAWTVSFPGAVFAYIEADCFGGTCLYCGYLCHANSILARFDASDAPDELLKHVGIITRRHFEPFTRGFFQGSASET